MIKALYTSITGMNTMQNALSVTSNNIANAQTVGYKKQKAIFDDLLYNNSVGSSGDGKYAGTNPKSIGNGVKLSGTYTDYSTGSITLTGGAMQAAIEGDGFFLVGDRNGGNVEYTRKGMFGLSQDYYVATTGGQYVLGYGTKPGTEEIDFSSSPQPIQIPLGSAIGGIETDKATLSGNLSRDKETITKEFNVYDDEGNTIILRVEMKQVMKKETDADGNEVEKPVPGEYTYNVSTKAKNDKEFTPLIENKNLKFDKTGKLIETDVPVEVDEAGNIIKGGTVDIPFGSGLKLDLSGLTNYPTENTIAATGISGRPAAVATGYVISDGGAIVMTYSNGSMKVAGQLAVATFPNSGGLMKLGNGNYTATPSAGIPGIGVSGENGAGDVRGGAEEGSNVDLAVEFVDLMLYQRGFQGNAKVIKVSDEVLNEVVNLIR
ncbi:flagellar hook protein FlgE [Bacillus cereus]|nr:flagellar hook protein FlgE [Bacillus cereus]PGU70453.1 flagellar hook protein FlgE [Bacillus cereus]